MSYFKIRLASAVKPALIHLLVCLGVGACIALLVFGLWYPAPFDHLANGRQIFTLLLITDITVGPLLTLIVFDKKKNKIELVRDLSIILTIQLAFLIYGLFNLMQARPVWLAFEGNRFRVVSVPDIDLNTLSDAPRDLQNLSLSGPKLVGVRLAEGQDPDYRQSIEMSLNGLHPSFRPQRWVNYHDQISKVIENAKPLENLYKKHPDSKSNIDYLVASSKLKINQLGYMPLLGEGTLDWTIVISLENGMPKGYLALDAWN